MSRTPHGPDSGPGGGVPEPRIVRLPDALIDQIAAGEVVERPASVVKELVENAVDAGARRLRIEVRDGGCTSLVVQDDGLGMSPDEARLAIERHATSKLRSAEDLLGIATFGFRGEALPAIASVSRFRLKTRTAEAEEGFEIRIDQGRDREERTAGGPIGTRVEVADLFGSVPARRKFLKKPTTEWGHIADWLARAALALPGVHFDVVRDEKEVLRWPACEDPLDRIAAVLSEREAEGMVPVHGEAGPYLLEGFASRPDVHRPNASSLYLYVNGRPVRDRLLRHALLHVYRDWLPRGRYPAAVLHVHVPPDAVDVNVHPAKWEVRFTEPQEIHRLFARAVRTAMEDRSWVLAGDVPQPTGTSAASTYRAPAQETFDRAHRTPASSAGPGSTSDWVLAERPTGSTEHEQAPRFAELRLVGQLHATYLLAEDRGGLVLIDQHAAHERVLYERLRASWLDGKVERQALLLPVTIELAPRSAAALQEHAELVQRLGFELEAFGPDAVLVRAVPALLAERDPAELVRELSHDVAGEGDGGAPASGGDVRRLPAADRLFATLACHAARRAGDVLEPPEQRALLEALDGIPYAPTCPHGRPVAVPFSRTEIERRFGR